MSNANHVVRNLDLHHVRQQMFSNCNLLLIYFLSLGVQSFIIKGSLLLPQITQPHEYPQTVLIDGLSEHFVEFRGSAIEFTIDLPAGSHTLQVQSQYFEFDRIRIDIPKMNTYDHSDTLVKPSFYYFPFGWDLSATGPVLESLDNLQPRSKLDFFTPRPTFNIWSLLGNPMLIMSAVSLGMVFLIPKMKDAITDPELLKEMEERQKKNPGNPAGLPEMPDFASSFADYFVNQQSAVEKKKK